MRPRDESFSCTASHIICEGPQALVVQMKARQAVLLGNRILPLTDEIFKISRFVFSRIGGGKKGGQNEHGVEEMTAVSKAASPQ